jgi:hypothetical protein
MPLMRALRSWINLEHEGRVDAGDEFEASQLRADDLRRLGLADYAMSETRKVRVFADPPAAPARNKGTRAMKKPTAVVLVMLLCPLAASAQPSPFTSPPAGTGTNTFPAPTQFTNSKPCTMPAGTAGVIVPYSDSRRYVVIFNRSTGTETQDIGSSNVVVNGGIPLAPGGGGYTLNGAGAAGPIYGITTVGGSPCSYVEG